MTLNGDQIALIEAALLSAFHDVGELRIFVRTRMNENLNEIAGGERLRILVHELVEWAEKTGREHELVQGALEEYPGNPQMQQLAREARKWFTTRRNKLQRFFNIKDSSLKITAYLSRHSAVTALPHLEIPAHDLVHSRALQTLNTFQSSETLIGDTSDTDAVGAFTVVSALEMIEVLRLKELVEGISSEEGVSRASPELRQAQAISFRIGVCPEPKDYLKLLANGTTIFIGGPRANFGTYYYLFGEEAGKMRPMRRPKNRIEVIGQPGRSFECDLNHNLAIVQKHRISNNRTVFYLAGTGIHGTVGAMAYLRQHWEDDLFASFEDDSFCRLLEVDRRREEDIAHYMANDWSDNDWTVVEYDTIYDMENRT